MVHKMYSEDEESQEEFINYKQKYRELKKNLRFLIYENECFQDELRKAQRTFVSLSRDKSFLLDRILKYEKPQGQSSDSDATESSEEEEDTKPPVNISLHNSGQRKKITKRKRSDAEFHNGSGNSIDSHMMTKQLQQKPTSSLPQTMKMSNIPQKKPKKPTAPRKPSVKKERENITIKESNDSTVISSDSIMKTYRIGDIQVTNDEVATVEAVNSLSEYDTVEYEYTTIPGSETHLTREEVERHLESRRFSPELNTTATVPAELFSHEPDPESDFEESEICEFIQLDEDATSADMILE